MTDSVRTGLIAAYRKLMEPLVRILIRNGVSYGEFSEILKSTFVEVAERDFGIPVQSRDSHWYDSKGSG
jgi:hypothetical protein